MSAFKCQVVGALTLHNHLVYVREAMKAQEVLIFNIGHTSQLTVQDKDAISLFSSTFEETRKPEDFIVPDDASSSQTFTDGGPMSYHSDELGFFRCKALDLYKLVTSK